MIDFKRGVSAVEFMFGTTTSLELIDAFLADRSLCDALQLSLLLLLGQQILLLFLEEKGAMVETFKEVGLAGCLPFTKLVSFVLLELAQVRFKSLKPVLDQLNWVLADDLFDLFGGPTVLIWQHLLIKAFDELEMVRVEHLWLKDSD